MRTLIWWVVGLTVLFMTGNSIGEDFPYRKDYPDVPVIELNELKTAYDKDQVVIVDVRSEVEYNAIHLKQAVHIPISNSNFLAELQGLAKANPGKKIAVYCNGITCLKSYHAAQQARDGGLSEVYAFDAGVPAWAKNYPSETLLVGKEIVEPDKQLIPKEELQKRTLSFADFKAKAGMDSAMVIDARDPIQRTQNLPGLDNALPIPLDKLIKNIVNEGRMKDKQLLIFDQVGKQFRWLMYYLVDQGYTDYYFLDGGATAVLKEQEYR